MLAYLIAHTHSSSQLVAAWFALLPVAVPSLPTHYLTVTTAPAVLYLPLAGVGVPLATKSTTYQLPSGKGESEGSERATSLCLCSDTS